MKNKVTGRPREWMDDGLIELGEALVEHVQLDGVYHISSFEVEKELYDGCLEYLCKKYPAIFLPYYTRALRIIGNKMMRACFESSPDRWVIKTFLPRMLKCRDWVKEDIEMEAFAKAEAAKAANLNEIDPRVIKFLELLEEQKSVKRDPE